MGELKREYLTAEEKNFYMISKAYIQYCDGQRSLESNNTMENIWDVWKAHGMLTGSMQRNLKMVYSYMRKFCAELEVNLSKTEQERLQKQLNKFDYKLLDDYTVKKILRDIHDNIQYAVIKRERFEPILQDIAAVRCVGCTCNYEKCDLYKMFDDISIPYVKEEPNCPYACNLADYTEEDLKEIEHMKEIIEKKQSVVKEFNRKVEYEDVHEKPRGNTGCSTEKCKGTIKTRSQKAKGNKKNRKQKSSSSKK